MVRSIGADQVIAYTTEDFAQAAQRYDVMLDLIGNRSLLNCRRVLPPRATYVIVGVRDLGRWLGLNRQIKALLLSPFVRQQMREFVVKHSREDLRVLKELVEAGRVAPVIDRRYQLSEAPQALRHQGEGHTRGKIVIAVEGPQAPLRSPDLEQAVEAEGPGGSQASTYRGRDVACASASRDEPARGRTPS